MPAKSKAQQQAAAIAKHHPEKAKGAAKEMTEMSKKQLHDFASTPSKNLPEHVSKEGLDGFLDGYRTKTADALEEYIYGKRKEELNLPKSPLQNKAKVTTTFADEPKKYPLDLATKSVSAQAKRKAELAKHLALPATEKIWPQAKGRLEEQFARAAEQRKPVEQGWMKQTPPSDETMAALAPKPAEAPLAEEAAAPSLKDRLLASLQGGLESTRQFVGKHPLATAGAAVAGGAGLTAAALMLKRKLEAKKKPVRRAAVA